MSDLQFLDWAAGDKHPRPHGARDQRSAALPHFPLRAKAEPGNVNGVHLSPTVQAAKSNYSRAHGGSSVPYLDCSARPGPGASGADRCAPVRAGRLIPPQAQPQCEHRGRPEGGGEPRTSTG
ncbi:NDP-hexose 2,3-dehydratase family protein [Streptomyces lasiicapitis]|uniref:NDP-hexose 2,3-dehydratase family protein n=1 Tax=Streptomyces lasiicapitis TaxID=1923961 RepID=UPI00368442C3